MTQLTCLSCMSLGLQTHEVDLDNLQDWTREDAQTCLRYGAFDVGVTFGGMSGYSSNEPYTMLSYCIYRDCTTIARVLLEEKADINYKK